MRDVSPSEVRAVALDLDGVILDGMQFHIDAWKQAFQHFGIQVDPMDLYLMEGMKTRDVVDSLCTKANLVLTPEQREQVVKQKREIYSKIFRVVPLPGGSDLVRTLSGFGYRLALVTGTSNAAATNTLLELHLKDLIPLVVSSESVTNGKPAPDPYVYAADLLAVPLANCLVVENAPPGISSALAAGLKCLAVASYLPAYTLQNATRVFDTMDDLIAWFVEEHQVSRGLGVWHV